jgi:hypothetical protein
VSSITGFRIRPKINIFVVWQTFAYLLNICIEHLECISIQ